MHQGTGIGMGRGGGDYTQKSLNGAWRRFIWNTRTLVRETAVVYDSTGQNRPHIRQYMPESGPHIRQYRPEYRPHIRQYRPESGLAFKANVLKIFQVVPVKVGWHSAEIRLKWRNTGPVPRRARI